MTIKYPESPLKCGLIDHTTQNYRLLNVSLLYKRTLVWFSATLLVGGWFIDDSLFTLNLIGFFQSDRKKLQFSHCDTLKIYLFIGIIDYDILFTTVRLYVKNLTKLMTQKLFINFRN